MRRKFISRNNFVKLLNIMNTDYIGGDFVKTVIEIYGDEFEKDEDTGKWHKIEGNEAIKPFLGDEYETLPDVM